MVRAVAVLTLTVVSVSVGSACPWWGRCSPQRPVVLYPNCPPAVPYCQPSVSPVVEATPPAAETKPAAATADAAPDGWCHIRGRVVYDGDPIPVRKLIPKSGGAYTQDWEVSPTNRGVKNVIVWLAPGLTTEQLEALKARRQRVVPSFNSEQVYPGWSLKAERSFVLGEPVRAYVPHIVAAQAESDLVIRNLSLVPQNVKWESRENGEMNVLLAPGQGERRVKGLKAERLPIEVTSSIYPWMRAYLRVFDHPYFAVTDADGNFEIKFAPKGDLRLFIWQETTGFRNGAEGRFGEPVQVPSGQLELGEMKLKPSAR